MKLEVGQFVKTKDGIIDKVIIDYNGHCASPNCECKHISCAKNYYDEDKIIKASYNIINILEVGDVITTNNLCGEITKIDIENNKIWISCCDYETCSAEDIKTIVTKEQMEQMAYKIRE